MSDIAQAIHDSGAGVAMQMRVATDRAKLVRGITASFKKLSKSSEVTLALQALYCITPVIILTICPLESQSADTWLDRCSHCFLTETGRCSSHQGCTGCTQATASLMPQQMAHTVASAQHLSRAAGQTSCGRRHRPRMSCETKSCLRFNMIARV